MMMSSSLQEELLKKINLSPNCTKLDVLAAVRGSLLSSEEEEEEENKIKKMKIKKERQRRKNTCWGTTSGLLSSKTNNIYGFSSSSSKDSCFSLKPKNDDLHTLLMQHQLGGGGLIKKPKPSKRIRSQEEESDAEIIIYKKKKNKMKKEDDDRRPQYLPMEFKECIASLNKGLTIHTQIMLVIQKKLHNSDILPQQNRFSIPSKSIVNKKFLDDDEMKYLETRNERGILNRIAVNLIDPSLINREVNLARWVMLKDTTKSKCNKDKSAASSTSYVLNGPTWAKIVEANHLQVGDEMQLWALRVETSLWFALIRLPNKNNIISITQHYIHINGGAGTVVALD